MVFLPWTSPPGTRSNRIIRATRSSSDAVTRLKLVVSSRHESKDIEVQFSGDLPALLKLVSDELRLYETQFSGENELTIHAFTSKSSGGKSDDVIPKQTSELQSAVTHNAESVSMVVREDELELSDGQRVRINTLHQSRTYDGLLCGLPNDLVNGMVLSSCLEQAQALWHGAKPYPIEPQITRRSYEHIGEEPRVGDFLPAIVCIALPRDVTPPAPACGRLVPGSPCAPDCPRHRSPDGRHRLESAICGG